MDEVCFRGWQGEAARRTIVYAGDSELGLECPNGGRRDWVEWISGHARGALFAEARRFSAEQGVPDMHRTTDLVTAGRR